MREYRHIEHPFPPIADDNSRILILGSLPSVLSRESGFYYGNPRNRFWTVISALLGESAPESVQGKKSLLLANRIALWDVIKSCDIIGSGDSSIKNAVPNDIPALLAGSSIAAVYTNGGAAFRLYRAHIERKTGVKAVPLPSTSPANASFSVERLLQRWSVILETLRE